MSALDKYKNWSLKQVEELESQVAEEKGTGSTFLKIADGEEILIRAIPQEGGDPIVRVYKHAFTHEGRFISLTCPRQTGDQCPICEQAARMSRSHVEADKKLAKEMRARPKGLMNVLVRPDDKAVQDALDNGEEPPRGEIKTWEFSSWRGEKHGKSMHEKLLNLRKSKHAGGNFSDPTDEGFDIVLSRTGEKLATQYTVTAFTRKPRPLLDDEDAMIALIEQEQPDLQQYCIPPSYGEIMQKLQGEEGEAGAGRKALGAGRQALEGDVVGRASRRADSYLEDDGATTGGRVRGQGFGD